MASAGGRMVVMIDRPIRFAFDRGEERLIGGASRTNVTFYANGKKLCSRLLLPEEADVFEYSGLDDQPQRIGLMLQKVGDHFNASVVLIMDDADDESQPAGDMARERYKILKLGTIPWTASAEETVESAAEDFLGAYRDTSCDDSSEIERLLGDI